MLVTIYMSQNPSRGSRWPGQAEMWGEMELVWAESEAGAADSPPLWAPTSQNIIPLRWSLSLAGGWERIRHGQS